MLVSWSIFDEESMREYSAYGGAFAGFAVGLVVFFICRKKTVLFETEKVLCEKLRDAISITSFLSTVPTAMALIIMILYPGSDFEIMILLSAIMIVASMIIQAVFWHYAENIGILSTVNVIMLVVLLILMNVAALISLDNGHPVMLLLAIIMAVLPVLLMFDWLWSVDVALVGALICAIVSTIITFMQDFMQFGQMVVFWIPVLFIFLMSNRMKATFLMNDGKKLF